MPGVLNRLVLSVFSGIDLLGRGFREAGWCVVSAGDIMWGSDIREFSCGVGCFGGVIGGSPCPDFSKARRSPPTGYGLEMIAEYVRVVVEAQPEWWLLENVPGVPDVTVPGYVTQRLDVRANEFGLLQKRVRHIQVGRRPDRPALVVPRVAAQGVVTEPAALAREGRMSVIHRRSWSEFCALQGVTELELPMLTKAGRYAVVGNAVPLPVARAFAVAIRDWPAIDDRRSCSCGCGRLVTDQAKCSLPACRKRVERRNRSSALA